MIKCFHLTIAAPAGSPLEGGAAIFEDLCFEIEPRAWAEITGPASSGKSLLFDLFSLRTIATKGKLLLGGRNLDRLKGDGYADLRRSIGSCSQNPELLLERTALENLVLPLVVRKDTKDAAHKALVLLEAIGREHLRDLPLSMASREDQLLVGVLRALIGKPKMIFIDGCLEAFCPDHRAAIVELLEEARRRGATVVVFGRKATQERPDDAQIWAIGEGKLEEIIDTASPRPAEVAS